jgi:hypothetical protein
MNAQAATSSASRWDIDPGTITHPLTWKWPVPPQVMTLYDKYSGREFSLDAAAPVWEIHGGGAKYTFSFPDGPTGSLQRRILLLLAKSGSPRRIAIFAGILIRNWRTAELLLTAAPSGLRGAWNAHVAASDAARVLKTLMRLACSAEVGHWRTSHLSLVTGLDNRDKASTRRRSHVIASRQDVVSPTEQAEIVRVLDAAAVTDGLTFAEIEGCAALALIFQHSIRPVQVLCLESRDVRFFKDAADDLACVVSFHAAKQQGAGQFELLRQVKPEWVPIVARLHAAGIAEDRPRLFQITSATMLLNRARQACARFGVDLKCTANALRHTGAQTLADAGHSRNSIQKYLGHSWDITARAYLKASLQQVELINGALGVSKLYKNIVSLADRTFVSIEELTAADEDQQIGAVVGERLVAGVGICRSGQSNCVYNPVTSCYGCPKFMPSVDKKSHLEAVGGMREQVRIYLRRGISEDNPAYRQLTRALAGAQQALAAIDELAKGAL